MFVQSDSQNPYNFHSFNTTEPFSFQRALIFEWFFTMFFIMFFTIIIIECCCVPLCFCNNYSVYRSSWYPYYYSQQYIPSTFNSRYSLLTPYSPVPIFSPASACLLVSSQSPHKIYTIDGYWYPLNKTNSFQWKTQIVKNETKTPFDSMNLSSASKTSLDSIASFKTLTNEDPPESYKKPNLH